MRLLVIEDEARIAAAIKKALELQRYTVDVIDNVDSGLAAAIDPDYDLVILDRMLPGRVDGIALCRQVRQQGVVTPIIMLTALGEVDDRVDGLQAGADDYLQKPFAMKELIARIQTLLRRPRHSLGTTLMVDDLAFDPVTLKVTRGGKLLTLSAQEIKLLEYLLYNQGQVLSKEKIISHVWNDDMGYLRRKLDTAFPSKPPLIHTVRGFGYRIGVNS
jgi:two-component system OmpR family response regulator